MKLSGVQVTLSDGSKIKVDLDQDLPDYVTLVDQSSIDNAKVSGRNVRIMPGRIEGPLVIDYTDAKQIRPRLNFTGSGMMNSSLISMTAGEFALKLIGAADTPSWDYSTHGDFSVLSGAPGAYGILVCDKAFFTLRNVYLEGLDIALRLTGAQICTFDNLVANWNRVGVELIQDETTPFNSIEIRSGRIGGNTVVGMRGGQIASMKMHADVQANGTMGDNETGGLDLHFGTKLTPGGYNFALDHAPGLNWNGGWAEANKGGYVARLTNDGAGVITHNITGIPFANVGAAAYVQHHFVVRNTRGGRTILNLNCCSFSGENDYVPDASREYVDADEATEVICRGCSFGSTVEQGTLHNV